MRSNGNATVRDAYQTAYAPFLLLSLLAISEQTRPHVVYTKQYHDNLDDDEYELDEAAQRRGRRLQLTQR